ncbi:MAG: cytochrome c biogenesis protein CcdA [Syntrophomonadaceae bacterium]|nr:cytochrome c biogenesis protein CcdA [Syntrophomonadaceae bacterium]
MEQFISERIVALLQLQSPVVFLLVFMAGVVTSIGPCNIAILPLLVAYIGGSKDISGLKGFSLAVSFTLGTALTFALLGLVAALAGGIFGHSRSLLVYLAAGVSILVGLHMIGVVNLRLPVFGHGLAGKVRRGGVLGAFILGTVLGLASSQCGTPVLLAVLSLVMLQGNILYGALLLFIYALGRGVPLVLAGTFAAFAKGISAMNRYTAVVEKIAGFILIGFGLFFLWIA